MYIVIVNIIYIRYIQYYQYMRLTEVSEELVSGVELVPPGVREDLRAIAAWLDKHNNTDRLTVYAKLRAEALSQSLKV